jgi:hypothetical protein
MSVDLAAKLRRNLIVNVGAKQQSDLIAIHHDGIRQCP